MSRSNRWIAVVCLLVCSTWVASPALAATIRPLSDRVLIEVDAEERTAGGIIIPDTAKEKPRKGVVVAVGQGRFDDGVLVPMEVRPGDHVLFGSYAGSEVSSDGQDFLIMRESDIYAVIED